jgi:integrase
MLITVRAGWDDVGGEQLPKTAAGIRTLPVIGRLRSELARHNPATGRSADECASARPHRRLRCAPRSARGRGAPGARRFDPLQPHKARHTCASYLAAVGRSPKDVQTAMGHAHIATTL